MSESVKIFGLLPGASNKIFNDISFFISMLAYIGGIRVSSISGSEQPLVVSNNENAILNDLFREADMIKSYSNEVHVSARDFREPKTDSFGIRDILDRGLLAGSIEQLKSCRYPPVYLYQLLEGYGGR